MSEIGVGDGTYVVVAERKSQVNFLWGFLTAVCVAVLVRANLGAELTAGLVAIDVIFGLLLAGSVFAWIWFRRHPARLEISTEAITLRHRGQTRSVTLHRAAGDLYVRRTMIGGKHPLNWLMVTGSDDAISIELFDPKEIEAASLARGWRSVTAEEAARR